MSWGNIKKVGGSWISKGVKWIGEKFKKKEKDYYYVLWKKEEDFEDEEDLEDDNKREAATDDETDWEDDDDWDQPETRIRWQKHFSNIYTMNTAVSFSW
jgi:hypothetical protein